MIESIKAIIFDWGGVFVDAETKEFYPDAKKVLEYCRVQGYRLALAVIASKFNERKEQIEKSDLKDFFEIIRIGSLKPEQISDPTFKGKDVLYEEINNYLKLPREQVLIIDDRTVRGIRYANEHGHPSIWVQKGKFANELPNETTGYPIVTVKSLKEIVNFV